MDTYAIIGKLRLQQIEGARTLQMGWYGGLPYAVSKDFTEDELVVIFLPDGQISEEFAKEHNLIAYNDPETGEKHGGFLGKNRKVRSINLMSGKIRSVGLVMKLDSLAFTGYNVNTLKEGDSFNELNGVQICTKFITRQTRAHGKTSTPARMEIKGMPMHPDTKQFYKFASTLEAGDLITVTLKLDGTSVRVANAYKEIQPKWYHRFFKPKQEMEFTVGTRRVVINNSTGTGYYGDGHSLYKNAVEDLRGKLSPGEAIYGEIVGWLSPEKPLFNRGGMVFKYGCPPGTTAFYVYNIKWTLPNGEQIDLPWNKIKARCNELGVKHVPEMGLDTKDSIKNALELRDFIHYKPQFIFDGDLEILKEWIYSLVDGQDPIDPSHIREGVVLRVERTNGTIDFYKAKSEAFYALEDKAKSDESFEDMEEMQDEI